MEENKMDNAERWIEKMNQATFDLDEINPHESYQFLQEYLSFYRFNMTDIDVYRCGTIGTTDQNIFIQAFIKKKSKGTVLFVHGYLDHTGGLSQTVNVLLANDYDVITIDLPGHGFSQGESGAIATFDEYVDAVKKGYEFICESLNPAHLFGVGHSTGAAILFHAVSKQKVELERLVLVAPLYFPYRWNLVKGMIRMVGKVIPKQKRRFKKNSQDEKYREFIKNDPLQVKWLKTDWLMAMEDWQKHIIYCSILRIPVYFIQGGKDTTVDYKRNVTFYQQKCRDLQIAFFSKGASSIVK
jgi:alpha-beta hydrolase superfamily lysophospholipase